MKQEEILNKAIDYSEIEGNFLEYDDCGDVCDDKDFIKQAFISGANCADETMIKKACEWLKTLTYQEFAGAPLERLITDELISEFRQAMKGK